MTMNDYNTTRHVYDVYLDQRSSEANIARSDTVMKHSRSGGRPSIRNKRMRVNALHAYVEQCSFVNIVIAVLEIFPVNPRQCTTVSSQYPRYVFIRVVTSPYRISWPAAMESPTLATEIPRQQAPDPHHRRGFSNFQQMTAYRQFSILTSFRCISSHWVTWWQWRPSSMLPTYFRGL